MRLPEELSVISKAIGLGIVEARQDPVHPDALIGYESLAEGLEMAIRGS